MFADSLLYFFRRFLTILASHRHSFLLDEEYSPTQTIRKVGCYCFMNCRGEEENRGFVVGDASSLYDRESTHVGEDDSHEFATTVGCHSSRAPLQLLAEELDNAGDVVRGSMHNGWSNGCEDTSFSLGRNGLLRIHPDTSVNLEQRLQEKLCSVQAREFTGELTGVQSVDRMPLYSYPWGQR